MMVFISMYLLAWYSLSLISSFLLSFLYLKTFTCSRLFFFMVLLKTAYKTIEENIFVKWFTCIDEIHKIGIQGIKINQNDCHICLFLDCDINRIIYYVTRYLTIMMKQMRKKRKDLFPDFNRIHSDNIF